MPSSENLMSLCALTFRRVDSSSSNPSMTTGAFLALALAAIAVFLGEPLRDLLHGWC